MKFSIAVLLVAAMAADQPPQQASAPKPQDTEIWSPDVPVLTQGPYTALPAADDALGSLTSPAHVTVIHNDVLVQGHVALKGEAVYIGAPSYKAHGPSPIMLQDHHEAVSFRNIWVRELN